MKTRYAVVLGIVAGFGLGSFAVHGLRAQTKPDPLIKPAYIIVEANVKDEQHYIREFFPAHIKAIEEAHGIYVVPDGKATLLQGSSLVNRIVILRFHDMQAAQAWYNLPDRKAATEVGEKYADFRIFAVGGFAR